MYEKILFSVDLNDESSWQNALPTVLQLCRVFHAELHILTVIPDLPTGVVNLYLSDDTGARLIKAAGEGLAEFVEEHVPREVNAKQHLGHGTVYSTILDTAEAIDADLIVMASHRPVMSDYLLGPNAARVVRHAKQSVLVVRP